MRFIEIVASICLIVILSPVLIVIWILCFLDTRSPIFAQSRLGMRKRTFTLYKFRTMDVSTVSVGTHMVDSKNITSLGKFLRKTKIDELPQLLNVIRGDMSLVGPRPNLPNQIELIEERDAHKVYEVRPGITGLAQINEIDMSTPRLLAQTDAKMIRTMSKINYCRYILFTVTGKGQGDRI